MLSTEVTEPRTAKRMSSISSIASTVFGDSFERPTVMVRLTAEMSLSDWAELAEMQRMCLAVSSNNGNSPSTSNGLSDIVPFVSY